MKFCEKWLLLGALLIVNTLQSGLAFLSSALETLYIKGDKEMCESVLNDDGEYFKLDELE